MSASSSAYPSSADYNEEPENTDNQPAIDALRMMWKYHAADGIEPHPGRQAAYANTIKYLLRVREKIDTPEKANKIAFVKGPEMAAFITEIAAGGEPLKLRTAREALESKKRALQENIAFLMSFDEW
jgi:hypothetical protein